MNKSRSLIPLFLAAFGLLGGWAPGHTADSLPNNVEAIPADTFLALAADGTQNPAATASRWAVSFRESTEQKGRKIRSIVRLLGPSGEELSQTQVPGIVNRLHFSADGTSLYALAHRPAKRLDGESQLLVARLGSAELRFERVMRLPPASTGLTEWLAERAWVVAQGRHLRTILMPGHRSGPLFWIPGDNRTVVAIDGSSRMLVGQVDRLVIVDLTDSPTRDGMPVRAAVDLPSPAQTLERNVAEGYHLTLENGQAFNVSLSPLRVESTAVLRIASQPARRSTKIAHSGRPQQPEPSERSSGTPRSAPPGDATAIPEPAPAPEQRHRSSGESTDAAPSEPAPNEAVASEATSSELAPSQATPSQATPSQATPSQATPSHTKSSTAPPSKQAPPATAPADATPQTPPRPERPAPSGPRPDDASLEASPPTNAAAEATRRPSGNPQTPSARPAPKPAAEPNRATPPGGNPRVQEMLEGREGAEAAAPSARQPRELPTPQGTPAAEERPQGERSADESAAGPHTSPTVQPKEPDLEPKGLGSTRPVEQRRESIDTHGRVGDVTQDPAHPAARGSVVGPAASAAKYVLYYGPNNILREAARIPITQGGWDLPALEPGKYRVQLSGSGDQVIVVAPKFELIDVTNEEVRTAITFSVERVM